MRQAWLFFSMKSRFVKKKSPRKTKEKRYLGLLEEKKTVIVILKQTHGLYIEAMVNVKSTTNQLKTDKMNKLIIYIYIYIWERENQFLWDF